MEAKKTYVGRVHHDTALLCRLYDDGGVFLFDDAHAEPIRPVDASRATMILRSQNCGAVEFPGALVRMVERGECAWHAIHAERVRLGLPVPGPCPCAQCSPPRRKGE